MAWIETPYVPVAALAQDVATHEGGVDRNIYGSAPADPEGVATHEGGVDRNALLSGKDIAKTAVATHEGGVDRNEDINKVRNLKQASPPTRVAWIETFFGLVVNVSSNVATHEGGVDRN